MNFFRQIVQKPWMTVSTVADEPASGLGTGLASGPESSAPAPRQAESSSAPPMASSDDPLRIPTDPAPIKEPNKPTRDGEAEAS